MRAFADPTVSTVVFVSAAQMGKTETILCLIGWRLDDRPAPVIYVGPTENLAKSVMKDRLDQLIASTPSLEGKTDRRRGFNTTKEKWVSGVRMGIAWAGSSVELMSHPVALCIVDERDAMEDGVKNAGDPVLLAMARTKNFRTGKTGIFSTPTLEGESAIWAWWEAGSRHRWYMKCDACAEWFLPRSELLRWPEGATPEEAKVNARLVCDGCGVEYDDAGRLALEGKYFPHVKQGDEYVRVDTPVINSIRSFQVSGLASRFTPMGEIAFQLRGAYEKRDPLHIQTALNAYCGEIYKMRGESPGWHAAWECRASYENPPPATQLITCGVDVQKDKLYYTVRAWCYPNATSYQLEHGEVIGETKFDDVWLKLRNVVGRTWGGRAIDMTLIDSGYRPGDRFERPENQIYAFCRRTPKCFPSKGRDRMDRPYKMSKPDVRSSGKTARGALKLWWVNTHHWKAWLYARINWPTEDPGGWHLVLDVTEDYCKQVTNEELVQLPSGKLIWQRTGTRENHYLDCEVLTAVAAHVLGVQNLPPPAPQRPPPKSKVKTDPKLERRSI